MNIFKINFNGNIIKFKNKSAHPAPQKTNGFCLECGLVYSKNYYLAFLGCKNNGWRTPSKTDLTERQQLIINERNSDEKPNSYQKIANNSMPKETKEKLKQIAEILDIDYETALNMALKNPKIILYSNGQIASNFEKTVNNFKDEGLTAEQYIRACIKYPQLFSYLPETIENNIRGLAERFKDDGLTVEKYIPICITSPTLFTQSPDTIAEHVDILRFCEFNKEKYNQETFIEKWFKRYVDLTYSTSLLFIKNLIISKMFEKQSVPKELKGTHLKQKLNDYLTNHPNSTYQIRVKNTKTNTDCIKLLDKTLKEISQNALNRDDIFELIIEE